MNPLIKNCRTGFHDDILNRSSHYCKLLNTKSTISNKHDKNYLSLLNNKAKKQEQTAIFNYNHKLMKSLIDIDRKYTRYGAEFDTEQSKTKRHSRSIYEDKQKQLAISQDNVRLYKKISNAQPQFSIQSLKRFNQKIDKYSKLIHHPLKKITEMDNKFFNTYQNQLFNTKLSPTKYKHLQNQFTVTYNQKNVVAKKRNKKKLKKIISKTESINQLDENPEKIN